MIRQAGQGINNKTISLNLGWCEDTIGLWRQRWLEGCVELEKFADKPKELRIAIGKLLADKARPGSPGKFSAEQVCQFIALAGETPPEHLSHWTYKDLVREAVNRGIVESLSTSSAGRFLKSGGTQAAPDKVLAQP
ncbi:MAG: helix-turn-helix domain-containing protein [Thioploca sp.]|nr:helix-turn-helix domain-containing protein [Thioploca sp.]